MKLGFLLLSLVSVSIAQPAAPNPTSLANAVWNDLQERASQAITSLQSQVPLPVAELRARLERSLSLNRVSIPDDAGAQLYLPPSGDARMPAVIVLEPHSDKSNLAQEVFPASLSRLGLLTIVVDTFPDHSRFDRLIAGVTPETLMQAHVRSALTYLRSRSDVDPARIGLVADSFAGTIAAVLNPELSAVVLTHAAPDLKEELAAMRNLSPADLPDGCLIVPGLLDYADSIRLLSAVAPRPLLLFESRQQVLEGVRDSYSSQGVRALLREREDRFGSAEWRMEVYRWLGMQLTNRSFDVQESDGPVNVTRGRLPASPVMPGSDVPRSQPVTQALLDRLLGAQIPMAKKSFVVQVAASQVTTVTTQPGIGIPMTVLRPGPLGAGYQTGIIVAFSDAGRDALKDDPFLVEAVRKNWMVLLADPRGLGELKPTSDAFVFAASTLLGENFVWRQAADIARIAEIAMDPLPHRVSIYANGKLASLIAGYAANIAGGERLEWLAVRDGPLTADDLFRLPLYAVPLATQDVFDLQDLFGAMPSNALFIGEPPVDLNRR